MNVNDLYKNIPEDQYSKIVVSDGAVSITQQGKSPLVLLKKTADTNADLTDGAGKKADRAYLEKSINTLKRAAEVESLIDG